MILRKELPVLFDINCSLFTTENCGPSGNRTGIPGKISPLIEELLQNQSLHNLAVRMTEVQYNGYQARQTENSGHLWLAYTELQGGFNMLQLISVDSGHFRHALAPLVD